MLWVMGCMGTMEATPAARPSIGQCTKLLQAYSTFAGAHEVLLETKNGRYLVGNTPGLQVARRQPSSSKPAVKALRAWHRLAVGRVKVRTRAAATDRDHVCRQ